MSRYRSSRARREAEGPPLGLVVLVVLVVVLGLLPSCRRGARAHPEALEAAPLEELESCPGGMCELPPRVHVK